MFFALVFIGCSDSKNIKEEPLYQEQWAINYDKAFYDAYAIDENAHINAQNVLNQYTGKGVKIAVIDIGLDVNHPEFKNNIIKTVNSRDASDDVSCSNSSSCYHGTAVTGVIASNINGIGLRGIAPDVEIVFIKLDLGGYIGDSEILDAFEYAELEDVDIVNCSWGTGDVSPIVEERINQLSVSARDGKGMIFVFASGNESKNNPNDESMLESVIGVGSSDEENLRAYYSNFGDGLDVVAPGGYALGVTTTYDSNDEIHLSEYMRAEDYEKFQGTSASAPIVTGSIALLLEVNSNLTRIKIQKILRESSDKIGNIEYIDGKNDYYGYGKINLNKAISSAKQ